MLVKWGSSSPNSGENYKNWNHQLDSHSIQVGSDGKKTLLFAVVYMDEKPPMLNIGITPSHENQYYEDPY